MSCHGVDCCCTTSAARLSGTDNRASCRNKIVENEDRRSFNGAGKKTSRDTALASVFFHCRESNRGLAPFLNCLGHEVGPLHSTAVGRKEDNGPRSG